MHIPQFKGPIEGFVVNFLKKSLWRIASTHTREDALQEAHLVFLSCAEKYPEMDTPQHFMALFKTSWFNHFNDLSTAATKARLSVSFSDLLRDDDEGQMLPTSGNLVGSTDNEGALLTSLRQAPQEVLAVLNLFLVMPKELLELALEAWALRGKKVGGERFVETMLGLKTGTNPLKTVEDYFLR